MSSETVKIWLDECARTANSHEHAKHMNLISRKVSLTGVPGIDEIGFDGWSEQCQHEFENKVLKSVSYGQPQIVIDTPKRIMFRVFETVEGTDGTINAQGVEMLIELEDDDQWRLVQERVLSKEETGIYDLTP